MFNINFKSITNEAYKRMTPFEITYGFSETIFGKCLLGLHEKQICYLSFVNVNVKDKENTVGAESNIEVKNTKKLLDSRALDKMRSDWPGSTLILNAKQIESFIETIFNKKSEIDPINVLLKGTELQIKVWKYLIEIKPGETMSYSQVAEAVGLPRAIRAVATAIARNKVAYLLPCHRIVRKSGDLGKYGTGSRRKMDMLKYEGAL